MTDTGKTTKGFSADERAAMRQRNKELKTQQSEAEALQAVLDKIASLDEPDKTNAERIHTIITTVAPTLKPKLYYGSPAYADANGKVVCFYQERAKFKVRYGNFAFFEPAHLDEGTMWPTAWAITEISSDDEKRIAEIVAKAAGA